MMLFGLYTGGKDSTTSLILSKKSGYNVRALLVMKPVNPESYMFHYVNLDWTALQAYSMNLPIYYFKTSGEKEIELEDMRMAFEILKDKGFRGVVAGAIASKYQYRRVKKIADEIGLKTVTPLWGMDQEKIMKLYFKLGIKYMIVSVSAAGLGEEHLGWIIESGRDVEKLIELARKYSFNPTGEGGEYETFVIDAPIFKYYIEILKYEIRWLGDSGYLIIKEAVLRDKK
jgi:ABC transporter with metal-binding/Fe-S-binding domain ATP-binding protein